MYFLKSKSDYYWLILDYGSFYINPFTWSETDENIPLAWEEKSILHDRHVVV